MPTSLPSSRTAGANWVTVARYGPGSDGAPELFGDDGLLEEAEAEAAVGLVDRQCRPVELHHLGPDARVVTGAFVDGPDDGHRERCPRARP